MKERTGTAAGFRLEAGAAELYDRYVAPIMAPFVDACVEAADVRPGARVLDLACGTGFAARAAGERAGTAGRVAGVDVDAPMLDVAARRAAGLPARFDWWKAPADRLPFADGEFDALVCQQAAQFFPDLAAAMVEAARVVRPGGRVALTVWSQRDRSPYFAAQYQAICEVARLDALPSLAVAMGFPVERVAGALGAAGMEDVRAREVVAEVALPPLEEFAARHLEAVPWGAVVAGARPGGREAAARRMIDLLAAHLAPDGSARLPFASMLVTATRRP